MKRRDFLGLLAAATAWPRTASAQQRRIPVVGFVGFANKAIPLTEEEVAALGMEKHEIIVNYAAGDNVRIVDGPLESFTGVVESIEPEKNKVCVVVSMFGRETPVELELDQVEVVH